MSNIIAIGIHRVEPSTCQMTVWPDGTAAWAGGHDHIRQGNWVAQSYIEFWPHLEWIANKILSTSTNWELFGAFPHSVTLYIETLTGKYSWDAGNQNGNPDIVILSAILDGLSKRFNWIPEIDDDAMSSSLQSGSIEFTLHSKRAWAKALVPTSAVHGKTLPSDSLIVLPNSLASTSITSSLSNNYKNRRQKLIDEGAFEHSGDFFRVTRPVIFGSPSAAACVLTGSVANGRTLFRDSEGRSYALAMEMAGWVSDENSKIINNDL